MNHVIFISCHVLVICRLVLAMMIKCTKFEDFSFTPSKHLVMTPFDFHQDPWHKKIRVSRLPYRNDCVVTDTTSAFMSKTDGQTYTMP